jgi:small subunit ribosomal protein S1
MSDEGMDSLEALLEQHDYDMPQPGDIRKGTIVAITPQGVIIDLGLKRDGFVPSSDLSKLEPGEREALQVNDEISVYIAQSDEPDALTVSIHLARLNQDWIEAEELMNSGEVIQVEVLGYNKGGAIVPYGRIRGFIPVSHLSDLSPGMNERKRQQRLAKMRGEMIPAKIIEVDRRRRRLVLSQREAQREWEEKQRDELMQTLQKGDRRTGRISGLRDFGAFVDLGGADGLIHISELAWHRVDHPREVLKVGDEVEVEVLDVDRESGRISLSRKKLMVNPWTTVEQRYDIGQLVEGKITRIVDFGAFAEIEPGIEGLLHTSQLSRGAIENPHDVVKEGETHLLRVVSIDQKRQRIGLSLRAVTAMEQIEWMAQKEIEEAQRADEEAAAAAVARPSRQKRQSREPSGEQEETALETATEAVVTGDAEAAVSDELATEAESEAALAEVEVETETSLSAEEGVAEEPASEESASLEAEVVLEEEPASLEETPEGTSSEEETPSEEETTSEEEATSEEARGSEAEAATDDRSAETDTEETEELVEEISTDEEEAVATE